jgi:outer membrane biosynthesis protein TonB
MQTRTGQRRQMEGWGFSLILHGVLLGTIVPAFRHLPIPIHSEPFRWNVTFAELPQQTTSVESDSAVPLATTSRRAREAEVPGSAFSETNAPRSPKQTTNDRHPIAETSSGTRPLSATPPPTLMTETQPEVSPQMPATTQMTPVVEETLPSEQPDQDITTSPTSRDTSAQPIATIEQELPSPPGRSVANTAMVPVQPLDTVPASSPPAPLAASGQPSAPQTDYSWLQRAVSRRLEELKRSSRPSLDNSSRLKVLVKAVVSSTGELMEAEVVTSSGLDRIDQEAMRLVQHAFPMLLDHTLDRQQVVMRIPIVYSRD